MLKVKVAKHILLQEQSVLGSPEQRAQAILDHTTDFSRIRTVQAEKNQVLRGLAN